MAQDGYKFQPIERPDDWDLSVVERRLAMNKRRREGAFTDERRSTLDREITRDTPRGFWESMFTDEYGQETFLPIALPFIGSGDSGIELLNAHRASERGTASREQAQILQDFYDFSVRPTTTWGQAAGVAREIGAFGVEFWLSGGLGTMGRTALAKGSQKLLGNTLSKVMVTGFREKVKTEGAKGLALVGLGFKEAAEAAPGQAVRMTLQGEAANLAGALVGIEVDGSSVRGGMYMNYIRNRYRIVPDNVYGASVRVIDDSYGMWSNAMPHAVVDNLIEVFSEHTGVALAHMVPALKLSLLGKAIKPGGAGENILAALGLAGDVPAAKMLRQFGLSGVVPEMGEEFIGAITRDVVHQIAPSLADEGNTEYLVNNIIPITLGMGLGMFGMSGTMGSISYADGLRKYGAQSEEQKAKFWEMNKSGSTEEGRQGVLRGARIMMDMKRAGLEADGSAELAATAGTRVSFYSSDGVDRQARLNAEAKVVSGEIDAVDHDSVMAEKELLWSQFHAMPMLKDRVTLNEETGEEVKTKFSPAIEFLVQHEVIQPLEAEELLVRVGKYLEDFHVAIKSGEMDAYWEALGVEGLGIQLARAAEAKVSGAMDPNVLQVGSFVKAQQDLLILQELLKDKGAGKAGDEISRRVFEPKLTPEAAQIHAQLTERVQREYDEWAEESQGGIALALAEMEAEALAKTGENQDFQVVEDKDPHEMVLAAQSLGLIVIPISSASNSFVGYWSRSQKILFYNPAAIKAQAASPKVGMSENELFTTVMYRELLRAHVTDLGEGADAWLKAASEWLSEVDPKFKEKINLRADVYEGEKERGELENEVTLALSRFALLNRSQRDAEVPDGFIGWVKNFASMLMEIALPKTFWTANRLRSLAVSLDEAGFDTENMSPTQIMMVDATAAHVHQIVGMLSPAEEVAADILSQEEQEEQGEGQEQENAERSEPEAEAGAESVPQEGEEEDVPEEAFDDFIQGQREDGGYDTDPDAAPDPKVEPEPELTEEELRDKEIEDYADELSKLSFKKLVELGKEFRSQGIWVENVSGSKATIIKSILTALRDSASGFMAMDEAEYDAEQEAAADRRELEEEKRKETVSQLQPLVDAWYKSLDIAPPTFMTENQVAVRFSFDNPSSTWLGFYLRRARVFTVTNELLDKVAKAGKGSAYVLEVFGHEVGHGFHYDYINKLDPDERASLDADYKKWLEKHMPLDTSDNLYPPSSPIYQRRRNNLARASKQAPITSQYFRGAAATFDPDESPTQKELSDAEMYTFSQEEWIADQTSIYLMTGKYGFDFSGGSTSLIRRLAKSVYNAYRKLAELLLPGATTNEVSSALKKIIENRVERVREVREYFDMKDEEDASRSGFMAMEETGNAHPDVAGVTKVISGAQTGADQAGLSWAKMFGLKTGGYMPHGWTTETGVHPEIGEEYGLTQSARGGWADRTYRNVENSDGTVYFGRALSPGWKTTRAASIKAGKPFLSDPTVGELRAWIKGNGIKVLNVAGNRASGNQGIEARVTTLLANTFDPDYEEERRSFPRVTTSINIDESPSSEDVDKKGEMESLDMKERRVHDQSQEEGSRGDRRKFVRQSLRGPGRIMVPFSAAVKDDKVLVNDSGAIHHGTVISRTEGGNVTVEVEEVSTVYAGIIAVRGGKRRKGGWGARRDLKSKTSTVETHSRNLYHPKYSLALVEKDGRLYWRQGGGQMHFIGWSVPPEEEEGEGVVSKNIQARGGPVTQGLAVSPGGRSVADGEDVVVTEMEIQDSGRELFEKMYEEHDLDQFVKNEEGRVGPGESEGGDWLLPKIREKMPYVNTMSLINKLGYANPFMSVDEYEAWLRDDKPQSESKDDLYIQLKPRKDWILNEINEGELDGIQLGYPYIGHRSHAHVLQELVAEIRGKDARPTVRLQSADAKLYIRDAKQDIILPRNKATASRFGMFAAIANLLDTDISTAKKLLKISSTGLTVNDKAIRSAMRSVNDTESLGMSELDMSLAEVSIGNSFRALIDPIMSEISDMYSGGMTELGLAEEIKLAPEDSPRRVALEMLAYSLGQVDGRDASVAGRAFGVASTSKPLDGEEGSRQEESDIGRQLSAAGFKRDDTLGEESSDSAVRADADPELGIHVNVRAAHEVIGHYFALAVSTSSHRETKKFNDWRKANLPPVARDRKGDPVATNAWWASWVLGTYGHAVTSEELYVLFDLTSMFPGNQSQEEDPHADVDVELLKTFRRSLLADIANISSDLPVGPQRSLMPTVSVIDDGSIDSVIQELIPTETYGPETALTKAMRTRIGELSGAIVDGKVEDAAAIVEGIVSEYATQGMGSGAHILAAFRRVSGEKLKAEMAKRRKLNAARENENEGKIRTIIREIKSSNITGISGWARALVEEPELAEMKPLFKHVTLLARLHGLRATLEIRGSMLQRALAPRYGEDVKGLVGQSLFIGAQDAADMYRSQAKDLDTAIEMMGEHDYMGLATLLSHQHGRSPEMFVSASKERYLDAPIIPRFQDALESIVLRGSMAGKSVIGVQVPGGKVRVILDPGALATKRPTLGSPLDILKAMSIARGVPEIPDINQKEMGNSGFTAMDPVTISMRLRFEQAGGYLPSMWDASRLALIGGSRDKTTLFMMSYEKWLGDTKEWTFRLDQWMSDQHKEVLDYVELVEGISGRKRIGERDGRVQLINRALFLRMEMAYWQTAAGRNQQLNNNPSWKKPKSTQELWDHYAKSGNLTKQHREIFDLMMEMQSEEEEVRRKWAPINAVFAKMDLQQGTITDMAVKAGVIEKGVTHHMHLNWDHEKSSEDDVQDDLGTSTDVGSAAAHKKLTSVLHGFSLGWKLREMDGPRGLKKNGIRVVDAIHNRALVYSLELAGIIKKRGTGVRRRKGHFAMDDLIFDGYEAEKWVSKFLNNALSRMRVMDIENTTMRRYMMTTIMMKHNLLMLGFFHHHAFPRSYFMTVDGKTAWKGFFKLHHIAQASIGSYMYAAGIGTRKGLDDSADRFTGYSRGRELIASQSPLIIELIRDGGLEVQVGDDVRATASGGGYDMDEVVKMDESIEKAGKWLADKGAPKAFADKVVGVIQGVRGFQRQTATWLFNDLGSNLKVSQAVAHLEESLIFHAERLKTDYDGSFRKGLVKGIADLSNGDFGGMNSQATHGRIDTLKGLGISMPRHARTTMLMRALFLAPDWTESNLMTVMRTFWKDGDMATDDEMNNINRRLHQHMWLRVISRGLFLQITINAIMAGLDPDRDFLDLYREAGFPGYSDDLAPKWQKLRWLDANVSLLSPNESRKFISVMGHFADPFHWGTDMFNEDGGFLSPIMKKGSPGAKAILSFMTGVDWAGRRFSSFEEFWGIDTDAGVYQRRTKQSDGTYKEAGESKAGRYKWQISHYGLDRGSVAAGELFTYTLEQLRRFMPIQTRTLMDTAMGTKDEMDLLMDLLGFKGSRTWPKE